jgi:hypothetical protein
MHSMHNHDMGENPKKLEVKSVGNIRLKIRRKVHAMH